MRCAGPCGSYKNIDKFWKDKYQKSGYNSLCIDCRREYTSKNKDFLNISKKKYREKNKETANKRNRELAKIKSDENRLLSFEELCKRKPTKHCNSCDTLKETTKYRRDNSTNDGFKSDCKDCLCKKELIRYYQRKEKLNNGS